MLSFRAFWDEVANAVRIEGTTVQPETTLEDDLGLDSVQMLELALVMDELGAEVGEDEIPNLRTANDLYAHYEAAVGIGH